METYILNLEVPMKASSRPHSFQPTSLFQTPKYLCLKIFSAPGKFDIVIVGAGPVGLLLASCLIR